MQQKHTTAPGDERFAELCALATHEMERLAVPGASLGVIDGDAEYAAGLGVTNIEQPLPVNADTLFQIGSITKTVTATVAMCMTEQGRIDLDTPVRAYLPDLRLADEQAAARVTLRHLFNHTGGWVGDYFDDTGNGDDALARIVERLAQLPQITPLGTIWSYNNAGFYIAGRVLEAVSGKPYEALARELVLAPLGMDRSFFFPGDVMTYRFAVGHENSFEPGTPPASVARPWPLARSANPAGGISSTVRDLLRYARFHMGDGTAGDGIRILSPESLAAMQTPNVASANGEFSGIAWFIRDLDGVRLVRHGGGTHGQLSSLVIAPARRFAIVVLTNAGRGDELHGAVVKRALQTVLGLSDPDPASLEVSEVQLAEYVGHYDAPLARIELSLRDRALYMKRTPKGGFPLKDSPAPPTPPPTRVAFCATDRLIALDEPFKGIRGEFLRDPDGALAWLRIGGRVHRRQDSEAQSGRAQSAE